MKKRRSGFTLLEILIVLVILGIIAGLAVPNLQAPIERGRAVEAYRNLDRVRQAMHRYHTKFDTYVGATVPIAGFQSSLDFNPNETTTGTNYFAYRLIDVGANTYRIRATRQSFVGCGQSIGTLTIDETGTIVGTGAYI